MFKTILVGHDGSDAEAVNLSQTQVDQINAELVRMNNSAARQPAS